MRKESEHVSKESDINKTDIKHCKWALNKADLQSIRTRVFVQEQNIDEQEEWDEFDLDTTTQHIAAFQQLQNSNSTAPQMVASVRLVQSAPAQFKLTRLAVLPKYRNKGIAKALIKAACTYALKHQCDMLYLHAQLNATALYEKMGFKPVEAIFIEAGIEHQKMVFDGHSANALETIFADKVIRLAYPEEYIRHSVNCIKTSSRSLTICSTKLRDDIFSNDDFIQALSAFARSDRRASVRILLHSTKGLSRRSQVLIELTRRLPTKIEIKTLLPKCDDKPKSFISGDAKRLIYFNDETALDGFCCYKAGPESESLLDEFNYYWNHQAHTDPNLSTLNI